MLIIFQLPKNSTIFLNFLRNISVIFILFNCIAYFLSAI